jgi:hypothetical protein
MRLAKLSIPAQLSAAALDAVSAQKERVCPLKCEKGETAVGGRCVANASTQPRTVRKSTEADNKPASGGGACFARGGANTSVTFDCK